MRSHHKTRRTSSNQRQENQRGETRSGGGGGGGGGNSRQSARSNGSRKNEMAADKNWILLNVGGGYFLTSRSTLLRLTPISSPLNRLSANSTCVMFDRDDRGAYLIDRDPVYFAVVLNYLRHGHLLLTKDVTEEGVLLEAEYFNIPDLQRLIKQRISNRSLSYLINQQQHQQHQQQQQKNQHHSPDFLTSHHHQASSTQHLTINNQLSSTGSGAMSSSSSSSVASTGAFNSFGLGPIGASLGGLLEV